MRHSHCWRCCIHDQISWGCDVMPMFRTTVYSRCKALAVVNYVTAVQVHLTSKAFIIKLAQLHDFSAFVLSKEIILQTVCNREHSRKGGKAQLQCLQTAYNFSVPYMIFSKNQTSPASPGMLWQHCFHTQWLSGRLSAALLSLWWSKAVQLHPLPCCSSRYITTGSPETAFTWQWACYFILLTTKSPPFH